MFGLEPRIFASTFPMLLSARFWGTDCTSASPPAQRSCAVDVPNNSTYNVDTFPRRFLVLLPLFFILSLDPNLSCPGSSFVSPNLLSIHCPRLISSHRRNCISPTVGTRPHFLRPADLHLPPGWKRSHLGQFIRCNQFPVLGLSAVSYSGHLKTESQRRWARQEVFHSVYLNAKSHSGSLP